MPRNSKCHSYGKPKPAPWVPLPCGRRQYLEPPLPKPEPEKDINIVDSDITKDTVWDGVYKVVDNVRVRGGATLTVKPHTKVLFSECRLCNPPAGTLPFASLIVNSDGGINANDALFRSANFGLQSSGGLILLGTGGDFTFEDYATVKSDPTATPVLSKLNCVSFVNLGNFVADINSVTIAVMTGPDELVMGDMSFDNPGDDGLEIFGPGDGGSSSLYINNLTVNDAYDDAVDLDDNQTLNVCSSVNLRSRTAPLAVANCPPTEVVGPGLVEVVGSSGTTNTFTVKKNASYYFLGVITDKTPVNEPGSVTTFTGDFLALGWSAGQSVFAKGTATQDSSIIGFLP